MPDMRWDDRPSNPPPSTLTERRSLVFGRGFVLASAWAFVGKVGGAIGAVVTNALLARLLLPRELGTYFALLSVASVGALLSQCGVNQVGVRLVAESIAREATDAARASAETTFAIGLVGSLVVSTTVGLAAAVWHPLGIEVYAGIVMGVWLFVLAMQNLLAETFRGFLNIRLAAIFGGLISSWLAVVALAVVWALGKKLGLLETLLILTASIAISASLGVANLRTVLLKLPRPREHRLAETVQLAVPFLVTGLVLIIVAQIDIWMLVAFSSSEQVALYGVTSKLAVIVAAPLVITNGVVPPVIAQHVAQRRMRELEVMLRDSATIAAIPSLIFVVVLSLWGTELLRLLFGSAYAHGALILTCLSLGQLVNVLTGSCWFTLAMSGYQGVLMWTSCAGGAATVLGASVVASRYGAMGVAVVVMVSTIAQNIALLFLAKKLTGIWTHISIGRAVNYLWPQRS